MDNLNILHYSFGLPPKATGGLPLYVKDLSEAQKQAGYKISILLPKQQLHSRDIISKKGSIYYLENSLPIASIFGMKEPKDYMRAYSKTVIEKFLNELKPTVIHIHSFMGLPKEFLEVAKSKDIKLVYTTHDSYGLCLKCNFIDSTGSTCLQPNPEKCAKCNLSNGLSTRMSYLIGTDFYKAIKKNKFIHQLKSKYRDDKMQEGVITDVSEIDVSTDKINAYANLLKYYDLMFSMIDKFHFNSELTKETYIAYLPNIKGKVIPITLSSIQDHRNERNRTPGEILTIGYIGRKEPYKGIDLLIDALTKLHKENINFECLLYGDDFSKYDLLLNGKVKNMGIYENRQIKSVFDTMDLLVIPSIWKETFGFVGLEALSYGVPVLMSENVGCKDLLINKDCIFKSNVFDLFNKLITIVNNKNLLSYDSQITTNNLFSIQYHVKKINKSIYDM
ncbi:MAG: glycosyltransferase [Beduini sp.]